MKVRIDPVILASVRRQKTKAYIYTTCPDCGLQQWRCPSGITCDNGHGYGEPSDIPIAEPETEQGESLDEALSKHPKTQPKARERSKTSGATIDRDSLSLGEMGRIVERVFKFDFDAAYEAVMRFLKPGDDRRLDLGFLQNELDRSVEMAALAHRLFTNAREACEIFEIDRDVIQSSMREEARYKLEEDLRRKTRLKPITDTDVLSMMKMQDPAKWRSLRVMSVRMTATRDHLERIADLARKRIDTLSTLVEKKR